MIAHRTFSKIGFVLLLVVAGAALPARSVLAQTGSIDTIQPAGAKPGDTVTVTGRGFGAGNVRVTVSDVPAAITNATGSAVSFVVPALPSGSAIVRATNPGGRSGTIGLQILSSVVLNTQAAVQTLVGPRGGVLQTEDRGTTFTLTIPAAALELDTLITLTPVRLIPGLPFSGDLIAAARLAPDGLRFKRPGVLTLAGVPSPTPDPAGLAQAVVGFTMNEAGGALEVLPAVQDGTAIHVPVTHFSDAGVVDARIADFERIYKPIIDGLPATVSPQAAASLVGQLGSWIAQFGFELCGQTTLCKDIFNLGVVSLQAELSQALARVEAHVAAGEPFLARADLESVVKLMTQLTEISDTAANSQMAGFDITFDADDLGGAYEQVIALTRQQGLDNPKTSLLLLLIDLAADTGRLGIESATTKAIAAVSDVLEDMLSDANALCEGTDPQKGEALLGLVLVEGGAELLTDLDLYVPGIKARFEESRTSCPIHVSPSPASVAMFEDLQLSGAAVGYAPDSLSWTIDGFAGGSSVDASGYFTASNVSGTVIVVASSVADPSRYRRVAVAVVPIEVEVSPATATIVAGNAQMFTATVTGPRNLGVTWSATGGTIDQSTGIFSSNTAGTFTVRATSVVDSGFFDEATITVRQPAAVTLTGLVTFSSEPGADAAASPRQSLSATVVALWNGNELEVLLANGTGSYVFSNPFYCYPISSFQGTVEGGYFDVNNSDVPGDVSLLLSVSGQRSGSYFNGATGACSASAPELWTEDLPYGYSLVGSYVFENGELVAVDFNRVYPNDNGHAVTSTGRLIRE